jgi:hypothetical protein
MKPGTITHTIAVVLSSISSLFAYSTLAKAESPNVKASKKSDKLPDDLLRNVGSLLFSPSIPHRLSLECVIHGRKVS